jgi:putative transposase
MVRYRRNLVAGGTYFFTLTLADRRASTLVDHVESLRGAMAATRERSPFTIDAICMPS